MALLVAWLEESDYLCTAIVPACAPTADAEASGDNSTENDEQRNTIYAVLDA